jgi:hypothetical protein
MARPHTSNGRKSANFAASLGVDAKLCLVPEKLRINMEAAEYGRARQAARGSPTDGRGGGRQPRRPRPDLPEGQIRYLRGTPRQNL